MLVQVVTHTESANPEKLATQTSRVSTRVGILCRFPEAPSDQNFGQIMTASVNCARSEGSVKCAMMEHVGPPFAQGSAGPFGQLSRCIIEVWNGLDQKSWGRFCVASKWTNWSARFPGHGVHARWTVDRAPGPSVVAQNILRSMYCGDVRYRHPTGRIYKGCAAVAQVLGRCSALQKLTIHLAGTARSAVDNGNLAPLSLLVQLRELRVAERWLCARTGEDWTLSGMDSLTTLSCLEILELEPVDLAKLPALASVRDLRVKPLATRITEETAQRLAWPSLTALSLDGGQLSAEASERLTRNGKLRRLEAVSFDMVASAPSLVHVTVQGWSSAQPPSAPLFHKNLSYLAVRHGWSVEGTWCLRAPFMADPCSASLQSLEIGRAWNQDATETWTFVQWVTGASQPSLQAMDLTEWDHVCFPGLGLWLQELKELRRLQVGDLPDDARLPQIHELSIRGKRPLRIVDQIRNLPLWVPELRILWLYDTSMNFDGHLLTRMPQLRCLVLDSDYDTQDEAWQVLDEMLGCTCDCPETLVHMPKLRMLRINCVPGSKDKPKWLLQADMRNIVVAKNCKDWSLDHSVYTE